MKIVIQGILALLAGTALQAAGPASGPAKQPAAQASAVLRPDLRQGFGGQAGRLLLSLPKDQDERDQAIVDRQQPGGQGAILSFLQASSQAQPDGVPAQKKEAAGRQGPVIPKPLSQRDGVAHAKAVKEIVNRLILEWPFTAGEEVSKQAEKFISNIVDRSHAVGRETLPSEEVIRMLWAKHWLSKSMSPLQMPASAESMQQYMQQLLHLQQQGQSAAAQHAIAAELGSSQLSSGQVTAMFNDNSLSPLRLPAPAAGRGAGGAGGAAQAARASQYFTFQRPK
jgi:hypothetical protein